MSLIDLTYEEAAKLVVAIELALEALRDAQGNARERDDHLTLVFLEGKISELRLIRTRLVNILARDRA